MKENDFRTTLYKRLKAEYGRRVHCIKSHGNAMSSGLPDVTYSLDGAVGFFELKYTPDHRWDPKSVTELQWFTLTCLFEAGALCQVVVWWNQPRLVTCISYLGMQWARATGRTLTVADLSLQSQWVRVLDWPERGGAQLLAQCLGLLPT